MMLIHLLILTLRDLVWPSRHLNPAVRVSRVHLRFSDHDQRSTARLLGLGCCLFYKVTLYYLRHLRRTIDRRKPRLPLRLFQLTIHNLKNSVCLPDRKTKIIPFFKGWLPSINPSQGWYPSINLSKITVIHSFVPNGEIFGKFHKSSAHRVYQIADWHVRPECLRLNPDILVPQ